MVSINPKVSVGPFNGNDTDCNANDIDRCYDDYI